jgi:hypothetical protein
MTIFFFKRDLYERRRIELGTGCISNGNKSGIVYCRERMNVRSKLRALKVNKLMKVGE